MKKTITLEIKAADFVKFGYTDTNNCPITKALHRAGLAGYKDCGKWISFRGPNSRHVATTTDNEDYNELGNKVLSMFSWLDGTNYNSDKVLTPIPPVDFVHVLELDIL